MKINPMKRKSKYLNPISFALTSEWLLPNLYNRFYVFFFTVCLCEQRNWKKQRKQNQTLSFEVKHNSANGNRHTRTRNKKKNETKLHQREFDHNTSNLSSRWSEMRRTDFNFIWIRFLFVSFEKKSRFLQGSPSPWNLYRLTLLR